MHSLRDHANDRLAAEEADVIGEYLADTRQGHKGHDSQREGQAVNCGLHFALEGFAPAELDFLQP